MRVGDVFANDRRGAGSKDDRLQIVLFMIGCDEEGGLAAVSQGSGETAFEDAPLLLGPRGSERISCVQTVVAEQKIQRAVISGRRGLGDDFDTALTGTSEFGGVGDRKS